MEVNADSTLVVIEDLTDKIDATDYENMRQNYVTRKNPVISAFVNTPQTSGSREN